MEKSVKYFLTALAAIIIVFLIVLKILSKGATETFNEAMLEQDMLNGTITVENIEANIFGEVTFQNLLWKDLRGGTILDIPEGSFKVKILDVLTSNFQSTTIKELNLKDATVSVNLDENMNVDFIRHSPDLNKVAEDMKTNSDSWEEKVSRVNKTEEELKEIGERRRRFQQSKIEKDWKNFNAEGRKLNLNLTLDNCSIEVFHRDRHYLLRGVNFQSSVNTDDKMKLKLNTSVFGGTMIGRGMTLNGTIDFKSDDVPQCNVGILFQEVDPSSLGFGMNIHDKITLFARFTGPITRPIGKGNVKMDELHIPGISFTSVTGNIDYEDAMLNFTNVNADVYGGTLVAYGDYNIDTRRYNIYGRGSSLKAYNAMPRSHLHCDVDLNITIQSNGNPKETVTSGDFVSEQGRYSLIFFDSIKGKFKSEYGAIHFYDVAIMMAGYKIATDALSIVDGKLYFAPIRLTNERGELVSTFEQ